MYVKIKKSAIFNMLILFIIINFFQNTIDQISAYTKNLQVTYMGSRIKHFFYSVNLKVHHNKY